MKKDVVDIIGMCCRYYRTKIIKKKQTDVSNDTGYSIENISAFEHGRNNNAALFYWYIKNGLDIKIIKKIINEVIISEYFKNEY